MVDLKLDIVWEVCSNRGYDEGCRSGEEAADQVVFGVAAAYRAAPASDPRACEVAGQARD